MPLRTANIIGSGPNGLAAAITLARAGVQVTVYEGRASIGGACSSAEITLPGFVHDLGSSAYPMGVASPFFRSLPLEQDGVRWVQPRFPLAHPLDDGTAVALRPFLNDMAHELDASDAESWSALFGPLVAAWPDLVPELLGPIVHIPRSPLALARFGLPALMPAVALAESRFRGERARALFAGVAAHSVMPLEAPLSSAIGFVLVTGGHTTGWPVIAGGAQMLANALARRLEALGGKIVTNASIRALEELPQTDATLFDTSARALAAIAGRHLTPEYRSGLAAFKRGPGAFKVDWALSEPIPWTAESCHHAATIHVGGTMAEIARAEAEVFRGRCSDRPFVLVVQPSVVDPSRAPAGKHTAWGYCHVPNGSTADQTAAIERQIERFAPGFREVILARKTHSPAELEAWDPNLVGGDLSGGAMTAKQLVFRPTVREYSTSNPSLYLCSCSTPPGGGVHGMCGVYAAQRALKTLGRA